MSSTKTKISFFIYSLDFLSGSKKFKVFNREKNVSLVGLIFSLIFSTMIILYFANELNNYFHKINFSLISMEDNSEKVDATKYIGNETIVLLRFIKYQYKNEGKQIEIDSDDLLKIFKIKVRQANYEHETDDYEIKYYNMQNCTNYFTDDDLIKYNLPRYYVYQSLCPPYNKGLKLRWNKYGTSDLKFEIYLCNKNEDENCYSEEEIYEKYIFGELDYISFGFIQEYNIIDNYNHSNPLKTESYISEYYFYLTGEYNCESNSKYIYYESDDGVIFTNIKKYSGLRFDEFKCNIKERENIFDYKSSLVSITYSINMDYILNYKRIYVKLLTIIVDITGIARVIFFIGGYSISLLSKNYFSYKLFDEIFSQKYNLKNKNEINKNIKKYDDSSSQIPLKKNIVENKIKIYNISKDRNKFANESIYLKMELKKEKIQQRKDIKNNRINTNTSTNIIINEVNKDNIDDNVINKDNSVIKTMDDEKYSIILSRYLGYDVDQHKKRFAFWNFICSQFCKINNKMKIINSCAKMINNYLSLEKIINNGIDIDIILANCKSQVFNNIDILNKIIDDDFKKNIKNIKKKKE